ncbi:recombinase family protein [Nonomuraea sp. NPDC050153]|uniref:recombinase family protein n=1 Tax=Nonomuraea sp. NPDC050153 TaxID=3364359 RepID=UPI00378CE466
MANLTHGGFYERLQGGAHRSRRPRLDELAAKEVHGSHATDDLITMVGDLRKREIGFTSLHEKLDTTTPGGRLVFHVFAALAEFIRELIVAGTHGGLAAARARPHRRPPHRRQH